MLWVGHFLVTANQWGDSDLAPSGNGTGVPGKISPFLSRIVLRSATIYLNHFTCLERKELPVLFDVKVYCEQIYCLRSAMFL